MNDRVLPLEDGVRRADTGVSRTPLLHGALRAISIGGFMAGSLDLGAACLINRAGPSTILQAVASGMLGTASFRMGAESAMLGLILQWLMSWLIAAIYVVATYFKPLMLRRWICSGCAFGLPIYLVMNFVVVPLSAVGHRPSFSAVHVAENLLAMVWFGFVIAYCSRDWMGRGPPAGIRN